MITKINKKVAAGVFSLLFPLSSLLMMSCDDFFNQESNDVLYDDQEHLNNAVDSAWSVVGILGKLQLVADRTVVLGEVRGDLVDLSTAASSDLRFAACELYPLSRTVFKVIAPVFRQIDNSRTIIMDSLSCHP